MRFTRYGRIFATLFVNQLESEFAYRTNLLFDLAQGLLSMATTFGAIAIFYYHADRLNGWTLPQMLVLLGVFYTMQGAAEAVLRPSLSRLPQHVRLGSFDYTLVKPVPSQFLASAQHLRLVHVWRVPFGLALTIVSATESGATGDPAAIAGFILALAAGMAIVYSTLLALSALAFWFVRTEHIVVIFWTFIDAGKLPVDIYPGWLRVALSTVVPIGIAVTVPARAASGQLDVAALLVFAAVGSAALAVSAWIWGQAVKRYTGASA